jgi:hypothetical protein
MIYLIVERFENKYQRSGKSFRKSCRLPDIELGKQVGCLGNIWRDFVKRVLSREHLIIYSKADRDKVAILAVYLGVEAWPQVQHISPSGVARERRRPFRRARCFDQGAECGRRARLKWSSPKILAKHKGERSLYYCPRRIKRSRKILSWRFGMVVARDGGARSRSNFNPSCNILYARLAKKLWITVSLISQ